MDSELSLEDLSDLLNTEDHDRVVREDGQVISDEALAALLDRTVIIKRSSDKSPSRLSDDSGVGGSEGGEMDHSRVFTVLEEISNVVCNKTEAAKNETNDENSTLQTQDENSETITERAVKEDVNICEKMELGKPISQDNELCEDKPSTNEKQCEAMETADTMTSLVTAGYEP